MAVSKEELIQAVEYVVQSPFVGKVKGVSEEAELSVAKAISEASATLGTKWKEHEQAMEILTAAAKDPKPCEQVLAEYIQKETAVMEADFKAAQEAWEAEPKVDKGYVIHCQNEIKIVNEEVKKFRDNEVKEIERKIAEREKKNQADLKRIGILAIADFIFGVVFFPICDKILPGNDAGLFIGLSVFTVIFLGFPIYLIISLMQLLPNKKQVQEMRTQAQQDVNVVIESSKKVADRRISKLNEDIKRGYDEGSEFYRNLHAKQLEWQLATLNRAGRQIVLNSIQEIATDFPSAINHLKNALENFEALSGWATNFVRDQAQKEHNEEMEALERRRLYEQRKAAEAQEEAAREQTALLKKQADAARDQAAAAQAQAEAAKQQARDTEEIRRRMERGQ